MGAILNLLVVLDSMLYVEDDIEGDLEAVFSYPVASTFQKSDVHNSEVDFWQKLSNIKYYV